jgi:hypothetical protein
MAHVHISNVFISQVYLQDIGILFVQLPPAYLSFSIITLPTNCMESLRFVRSLSLSFFFKYLFISFVMLLLVQVVFSVILSYFK